jgi:hypothetical protein
MMGNLANLKQRTSHLINIINEIRKDPDRKIIILSKYVDHLKEMKEGVDKLIEEDIKNGKLLDDEIHTTMYIGAMKQWQREEAEAEGDIFFATNDLAREGLDIERLNTVILATSQKDVNQSVGRAMRKLLTNGDLRPLIIDFSDMLSSFKNHHRLRKQFYIQCKYITQEYDINDDKIQQDEQDKLLSECLETDPVEIIIDDNKDKITVIEEKINDKNEIINESGSIISDDIVSDTVDNIFSEKSKKKNLKKRLI